jgi:hypothetical protein
MAVAGGRGLAEGTGTGSLEVIKARQKDGPGRLAKAQASTILQRAKESSS